MGNGPLDRRFKAGSASGYWNKMGGHNHLQRPINSKSSQFPEISSSGKNGYPLPTPPPASPPPPSVSMRQGPRGESSQNCHLLRDGFIKSILWNNLSWQSADRGQRCHPRQFRRRPPSAPSNWGQFQPNFVASVSRFLSSRFTFHWILPHRLHLASLIVNNRLPSNQKPPSFPYEILSPANEFLH